MLDDRSRILGQEVSKARNVGQTMRRFGHYFAPYKLTLAMVAILIITSTTLQVFIPNLIGQAVDCYLGPYTERATAVPTEAFGNCWYTDATILRNADETLRDFGWLVLLIAAIFISNAILVGIQFFIMSKVGFTILRHLRAQVFNHIHRLSLAFYSRNEAGDIMSRLTNDVDTIQQIISFGLMEVVRGTLLLIFIIIAMLMLNIPLALLSFITLPLMFWATQWFSNQARKAFRQARTEIGAVNADLQESISAVREVQAFSREDENIEQFRTVNAANRDANIRAQAFTSALAPALEALTYISLALVASIGGLLLLRGQPLLGTAVSVGLIITFINYSQQFNRPVQQIALLWTNLQSAIAGIERIFDLMDEHPDLQDKPNAPKLAPIHGRVQLQNVHFAYNPSEPVLKGINITAKPGQMVALVGPTGAGKTSIINLLPRFYDVATGSVTIDDIDVRNVTRHSLRHQIGIVLQDTFLFSDTVLENIRYGRLTATDEEIISAAKRARAHDFIAKLPQGYQTKLGERGAGLSQGQRQLLAIARVILADPRLLILDEATSSVDTRTERQIQQALDTLLAGRTSFIIAHRLSTIRHADQVLYLEAGQIMERGTHEELLAQNGRYQALYMSQFRRQEPESLPTQAQF